MVPLSLFTTAVPLPFGALGLSEGISGKLFELRLVAMDRRRAEDLVRAACERLLANTVVESYRFEVEPADVAAVEVGA